MTAHGYAYDVFVTFRSLEDENEDRADTFTVLAENEIDAAHDALVAANAEWEPRISYGIVTGTYSTEVKEHGR